MTNYPAWIQPTHNQYCRAAGCAKTNLNADGGDLVPRLATAGTDLCAVHHQRFPRILRDLVTLHGDLQQAAYTKTQRPDAAAVQTSGMQDVGAYWNPHATVVRAELTDWTRFLVRLILCEKPVPEPTVRFYVHKTVTWKYGIRVVHREPVRQVVEHTHGLGEDMEPRLQLARIATHHAGWLSAYPFVGPYLLADALQHRDLAIRALSAEAVKRVQLQHGHCREYLEDGDYGPLICGAPLYAILRPGDHGKPSEILCSTNPRHTQLPRPLWPAYLDRQHA